MKKHLRRVICVLAVLTLMLSTAATAFASSVTYENYAEKFVFAPGSEYSPTDLFTNYKGVMPGDKLTQKITVRNDASEEVNVEIFMRALGASENPQFLDEMTLTVVQDGDSQLFHAPADKTAQLTDWVRLGEFESGAEVNLDVTLNVPLSMGNDCQEQVGMLDWQFKVVETPVPQETKTGDNFSMILPIALMCAAALAIFALLKRRKQEQ